MNYIGHSILYALLRRMHIPIAHVIDRSLFYGFLAGVVYFITIAAYYLLYFLMVYLVTCPFTKSRRKLRQNITSEFKVLQFWRGESYQFYQLEADVRKWHQVLPPAWNALIVEFLAYYVSVLIFGSLGSTPIPALPFMKFGHLMTLISFQASVLPPGVQA